MPPAANVIANIDKMARDDGVAEHQVLRAEAGCYGERILLRSCDGTSVDRKLNGINAGYESPRFTKLSSGWS